MSTTTPPATGRAILEQLADGLTDDQLRTIFPQESPQSIRRHLSELAARLPADAPRTSPPAIAAGQAITLFCDGASRGNPGEAAAGFVLLDEHGAELVAKGIYLGQCTNNVAEYQALILGLDAARQLKIESLAVLLDSELVVRQLEGRYQVRDEKLKTLYAKAAALFRGFKSFSIAHVPRSKNQRADQLANQAIDQRPR